MKNLLLFQVYVNYQQVYFIDKIKFDDIFLFLSYVVLSCIDGLSRPKCAFYS